MLPNTNYLIYIGGLTQSDLLLNYIKISTLPNDGVSSLNAIIGCKSRIDKATPGDINIWKTLEYASVNSVRSRNVFDMNVNYESSKQTVNLSVDDAPNIQNYAYNQNALHYMIHLGDFLSVENILRKYCTELLDCIIRYESNENRMTDILNQLEIEVVNAYRHALSNSVLKILFRHSAHIFLCGASEAGMVSTSFLAMVSAQTSAQAELRLLLTAAVVRICRRIHYSYMRQLWDTSFYDRFLEKDHIVEEIHRKVCISICFCSLNIFRLFLYFLFIR